jgi:hypothetical protein
LTVEAFPELMGSETTRSVLSANFLQSLIILAGGHRKAGTHTRHALYDDCNHTLFGSKVKKNGLIAPLCRQTERNAHSRPTATSRASTARFNSSLTWADSSRMS